MHKKLTFSMITLATCLTILLGTFIALPKTTHAAAPKVRIAIDTTNISPSQCTQFTATISGYSDYQTCVVTLSIPQSVSGGVHFSASYSTYSCSYNGCHTYKTWYGVAIALPEGNTITQSSPVHVILIVPYYFLHGYITMTFTFTGPANSVQTKITVNDAG